MGLNFFNIINCQGFGQGEAMGVVGIAPEGCMGARLGIVGLFFLIAIIRKWGGEEFDIDFSFMWSLILGLGAYLVVVTLTGSLKWSFLAGIIGSLIGGYLIGQFTGEGGYE